MNRFTDLFIKRPVLACVVSLLILLVGLRALQLLPLQQFPTVGQSVITITTAYPGANADLVKGFITNPIERSIAGADGIDYITATSSDNVSTITVNVKLGYKTQAVFTDIMSKIAQVRNQLPSSSQQPIISKGTGHSIASMYISYISDRMSPEQITEYVRRVVQPSLETVPGVSAADILGGKTFAMRVWLNPDRLAAYGITSGQVIEALKQNNFQSAAGTTKGEYVAYGVRAATGLETAKGFSNLVIKSTNGQLLRLRDVAKVQLGSEDYNSSVIFDGKKSVFVGMSLAANANPLTVLGSVRNELKKLAVAYPGDLKSQVVYDSSVYIRASLHEVLQTIFEATLIVLVVIYLFLGNLRSVLIPLVTIPLSLIGVASLMYMMGFSLNILTLLAMVLAIGMVVDDAIVVVENCYRHVEEGMKPMAAAIKGAREIAMPVIAMSLTLAAVYAPIGFLQGLTGDLFGEFAFTLAASVIISGVVALTLSPMMCSRLLPAKVDSKGFSHWLDVKFNSLANWYQSKLTGALQTRSVIVVITVVLFCSCFGFYATARHELAPSEDQSVVFMSSMAPEYANIDYVEAYTQQFYKLFESYPGMGHYMVINGIGSVNNVIAGMILKPWGDRKLSQEKIRQDLQKKIAKVAGVFTVVFPLSALPTGGGGLPIQYVLTSTASYSNLYQLSQQLLRKLRNSGMFVYVDTSLKFSKQETQVLIDRNKAGEMGISMQSIGSELATALGGNYIDRFSMDGQSYKVIPQVLPSYRLDARDLNKLSLRTASNQIVPLSSLVSFKKSIRPNKLEEFQQLNSVTIQGVPSPGKTVGDVVNYLQKISNQLPTNITANYSGGSRDYVEQGNSLLYTFLFALIVIYLVLAAQFESFRDPLIVMVSVPMSLCGALIFLSLGVATVNIYTQIGLLTLVGLISKHGILIVQFANNLQAQGYDKTAAVIEAAKTRMRPILMTTLAMVVGVIPLLLASGAQAHCRFDIGLVIASGMAIGTVFTLFVVPTIYTYIARDHSRDNYNENE